MRAQEHDFQRLHRVVGVRFTPEQPESMHEIVDVSLRNEERNASGLAFLSVQVTAEFWTRRTEPRARTAECLPGEMHG